MPIYEKTSSNISGNLPKFNYLLIEVAIFSPCFPDEDYKADKIFKKKKKNENFNYLLEETWVY